MSAKWNRHEQAVADRTSSLPNLLLLTCCLVLVALVCGCGTGPEASVPGEQSSPRGRKSAKVSSVQKISQESPPPVPARTASLPNDPPTSDSIAFNLQSPSPSKQKIYRPADDRPKRDRAALAELGIKRYASKHLELYTDIDPEIAKHLPGLVDQLYVALEKYFGPLPPDREGRVFQMTGYIMADRRLFRETGLLPEDLPAFNHGRHRGAEFWMNNQKYEYYLRHLMLHEATHCFMTITRQNQLLPPVWYMEGMAELFGTHSVADDGTATFRTMPDDKKAYAGLGRITLVQTAVKEGRFHSLDQVFALTVNEFLSDEAYAWSWALCKFLDTHPRYRDEFRKLGDAPSRDNFLDRFQEAFRDDANNMRTEWALYAHHLEDGYEIESAAIAFKAGQSLSAVNAEKTVTLKADRGWQSSEVAVEEGKKYAVAAAGRFTLAQEPKPWISEPDGISFRYFGGRPLGQLIGCIRTETPASIPSAKSMRQIIPLGANQTFTAPQSGTLYLRLNDAWNQLSDNTGTATVRIRLD